MKIEREPAPADAPAKAVEALAKAERSRDLPNPLYLTHFSGGPTAYHGRRNHPEKLGESLAHDGNVMREWHLSEQVFVPVKGEEAGQMKVVIGLIHESRLTRQGTRACLGYCRYCDITWSHGGNYCPSCGDEMTS